VFDGTLFPVALEESAALGMISFAIGG